MLSLGTIVSRKGHKKAYRLVDFPSDWAGNCLRLVLRKRAKHSHCGEVGRS